VYVLACSQGETNSKLVFILPFADLVIFNLDMKIKAAFTHALNKQRSAFSSEEIICSVNRELLGRPVSSQEV